MDGWSIEYSLICLMSKHFMSILLPSESFVLYPMVLLDLIGPLV